MSHAQLTLNTTQSLKHAMEDLASELAFTAQLTNEITKHVYAIKRNAQVVLNAETGADQTNAARISSIKFFLTQDVWDLESPPYLTNVGTYFDVVLTKFKDLFAYPFTSSPSVIGPYYRNWPQTNYTVKAVSVTNLSSFSGSGQLVLGGYTLLDDDLVLVTAQTNLADNGVYKYDLSFNGVSYSYTLTRQTAYDIQRLTVYVANGTSHHYQNTTWWNYSSIAKPRFAEMIEFDLPTGTTEAILGARSHKIYGVNYYQTVKDIETLLTTLKTTVTDYIASLNNLKGSLSTSAMILNADPVFRHKQTLDSTIGLLSPKLYDMERIASYFNTWIVVDDSIWTEGDRTNQIMAGHMYKPHKMVEPMTDYISTTSQQNLYLWKKLIMVSLDELV